MIKPDVMDGVPEEEGYYWVYVDFEDRWELTYYNPDKSHARYVNWIQDIIRQNHFSRFTWSERIAEPTTDVDNLN